MLKNYLSVALFSFCTVFLVALPILGKSEEQALDPKINSRNLPMTLQNSPLGFKSQRGIEGLQKLLQVSQPTQSSSVRQVIVPIPKTSPGVLLPQDELNQLPGVIATAEFYQIIEEQLSPPSTPQQSNFTIEGRKGKLLNGGILHLRVNSNKFPVTATIDIAGVKVPGYEQIRQIEFILPQVSTP